MLLGTRAQAIMELQANRRAYAAERRRAAEREQMFALFGRKCTVCKEDAYITEQCATSSSCTSHLLPGRKIGKRLKANSVIIGACCACCGCVACVERVASELFPEEVGDGGDNEETEGRSRCTTQTVPLFLPCKEHI